MLRISVSGTHSLFCPLKLSELQSKNQLYMTSMLNISLNLCVHEDVRVFLRGPWLTEEQKNQAAESLKNILYPSHSPTSNLACTKHTQTKTDEQHKQDHFKFFFLFLYKSCSHVLPRKQTTWQRTVPYAIYQKGTQAALTLSWTKTMRPRDRRGWFKRDSQKP